MTKLGLRSSATGLPWGDRINSYVYDIGVSMRLEGKVPTYVGLDIRPVAPAIWRPMALLNGAR